MADISKFRINGVEYSAKDELARIRAITITLPAGGWTGTGTVYSQVVAVDGITANSKVDLLPSPAQLNELLTDAISMTTASADGSVTVFCIGGIPDADYTMQALVTEVHVV